MFKYEIHLHSAGTSACGVSDSTEYIKSAKEKGYAGMVFTNHFYRGNTAIDRTLTWREFVRHYENDWLRAKELGDKYDIDVLFGLEEGYGGGKECLIYGLSPEDIAGCKEFPYMTISEISAFVRSCGGLIACAHPFRARYYIKNPDAEPDISLFDAIEVYNFGNTCEDNIKAEDFAKKSGLIMLSGGDVHNTDSFGNAGIILPERAKAEKDFVRLVKAGNVGLIRNTDVGNFGENLQNPAYRG